MSVSSVVNRKLYSGNGTTTAFGFPYPFQSAAELKVVQLDSNKSEVDATLNSQYSLDWDPDIGGTVTFTTAPGTGTRVLLYRDASPTQELDLDAGEVSSEDLEDEMDKLTFLVQRLQERVERSVHLRPTDLTYSTQLPIVADSTGSLLGFNSSGELTAFSLADFTAVAAVSNFWASIFDETDASNSLLALGFSPFQIGQRDETNASASLVGQGVSPFMIGNLLDDTGAAAARATLETYGHSSMLFSNAILKPQVGASAITIELKTRLDASPSATDPIIIAFRNSTLATADYTVVTCTTMPVVNVDQSSTLGIIADKTERMHFYALNVAGSIELAVMLGANTLRENDHVTTTAIGTTGLADSRYTLYSNTARTGVAARYAGYLDISQATPGIWSSTPSKVSNSPGVNSRQGLREEFVCVSLTAGAGAFGSAATKVMKFAVVHSSVSSGAMTLQSDSTVGTQVTINQEGLYGVSLTYGDATASSFALSLNAGADVTESASALSEAKILMPGTAGVSVATNVSVQARFSPGDIIRPHAQGNQSPVTTRCRFRIIKLGD